MPRWWVRFSPFDCVRYTSRGLPASGWYPHWFLFFSFGFIVALLSIHKELKCVIPYPVICFNTPRCVPPTIILTPTYESVPLHARAYYFLTRKLNRTTVDFCMFRDAVCMPQKCLSHVSERRSLFKTTISLVFTSSSPTIHRCGELGNSIIHAVTQIELHQICLRRTR